MSNSIPSPAKQEVHEPPVAVQLNEAVWQAWLRKGRLRQERNDARRLKALHWLSLAGLLAAGVALWSRDIAAFDVPIRFLVAVGAIGLMVHALGARHYLHAAVFGAVGILYNPVQPLLGSSGDWEPFLIVSCAIPFVASLTTPRTKLAPNA